ncbi:MAG: biopolymer transporter ExbD [Acidobacteria bacterium]|nr:MAG: biopolymer transporter ExbD [Acidobacteriota bacterium]
MRSVYQRPRPKATINITPYIDILLVLLIIFMVIQPSNQFQLGTRAPGKPAIVSPQTRFDTIVVSIDQQANIAINTQPVLFSDLGKTLFDILNARADRTIFIKGTPPELPFGDVARIIDIAKGAGAGDIGLI